MALPAETRKMNFAFGGIGGKLQAAAALLTTAIAATNANREAFLDRALSRALGLLPIRAQASVRGPGGFRRLTRLGIRP